MREVNKKKFVYTVRECERGFTFIEVIFTFLILSITMPMIVYLFSLIQVEPNEDISVFHLFTFIRNDSFKAETISIHDDVLYFYLSTGETAKIEQYQNVIRRQVDGKGHEIYARDIEDFKLFPLKFGTKVVVITTEGTSYEKVIAHY